MISFSSSYPTSPYMAKQNVQTLSPSGEVISLYYVLGKQTGFSPISYIQRVPRAAHARATREIEPSVLKGSPARIRSRNAARLSSLNDIA